MKNEGTIIEETLQRARECLAGRKGIVIISQGSWAFDAEFEGTPFVLQVYYGAGALCVNVCGKVKEGENSDPLGIREEALKRFGSGLWSACAEELSSGEYTCCELTFEEALRRAAEALEKIHHLWPCIRQAEAEYGSMIEALREEAISKVFG